jgi:hypothetical protein
MESSKQICTNCILPGTFPGIKFKDRGVCNFCNDFKGAEHLQQIKDRYRKKFEAAVAEYRGKGSYDVLMCYSGGKDSTYTLSMLKEKYGLNILSPGKSKCHLYLVYGDDKI